jgi:hypothetical protein
VPDSLLALLIQTGLVSITEDEIMDRSKSDLLAKIIALCQTLWFIAQSVARGMEGLSITNLEILTNAFAVLNFFTYFLWLNKPQCVRFPIVIDASKAEEVSFLKGSTQEKSSTEAAGMEDSPLIQSGTEAEETEESKLIQPTVEQPKQSTTEAGRTEDPEARREKDNGVTYGTPNHLNQRGRIYCTLKAIGEEIENGWKGMRQVFHNLHIPQWFFFRAFL